VIWRDSFDRWFPGRGWCRVGDWDETEAGGHGRFRPTQPGRDGTADIQFATDGRGRTTGLLLITPEGE